jgi:hypothetical protein
LRYVSSGVLGLASAILVSPRSLAGTWFRSRRSLDPEQVCADGRVVLAGLAESNVLRVTADFC